VVGVKTNRRNAQFVLAFYPREQSNTHVQVGAGLREASSFDVTTNGQRFLVNQRVSDSSDTPVTVILNWPQLLKQ
jgi:hypothetical protein